MSEPRAEGAELEARAWSDFEGRLSPIPRARWEEPDVLDGWTLKEMLWHVAGWLRTCAETLEAKRDGTVAASTGETVDEKNARFAVEAQRMDAEAVWTGVVDARTRVLRAWSELPEIDRAAARKLADETYEHYPDHLKDLDAFAG
jgi:hypothetical protein